VPLPLPRAGTCPVGKAFDYLSTSIPSLSTVVFDGATATSTQKLTAVFIPAAQSAGFRALRRDQKFWIEIMTVTHEAGVPVPPYGTFAWRFDEDEYFQPESDIGLYTTSQKSFTLSKTNDVNVTTGVYIFWDPQKGNSPSFFENLGQIQAGDTYSFTLSYNEGDSFDGSDSNTAHQLIECSGRGSCDNTAGKCMCLPGYTGVACQRTVCPNDCSGHGLCQTELRFASDGLAANLVGYKGYDGDQQYGCKCDHSYRGPDCSQSECPSGPDVLGADGGAEGMDCCGRGLCDSTTGTCRCFKGYYVSIFL
jgi:hypothetical protein